MPLVANLTKGIAPLFTPCPGRRDSPGTHVFKEVRERQGEGIGGGECIGARGTKRAGGAREIKS